MNILVWHVHGSWMTAFVHGAHHYVVPLVPDRGPDGHGRARTWDWPDTVDEIAADRMADLVPGGRSGGDGVLDRVDGVDGVDVVVVQRPRDLELLQQWAPQLVGRVPIVWVEHDTPLSLPPRHPAADRDDLVVAHVTAFNALMWDTGSTRTVVIEHGVVDPGERRPATCDAAVAVINEPVRRSWVAGTDLAEQVRSAVPVQLFGMQSEAIGGRELVQRELHDAMARHRVYLHPFRWTSLGLTLVEAMQLGMPVVALAATEVPRVLDPTTAVLAHDAEGLIAGVRRYLDDPDLAVAHGRACRSLALERFGLARFLDDWDRLLADVG